MAHYRFLDPNETTTMMRLAHREYRPPEIVELKRQIT